MVTIKGKGEALASLRRGVLRLVVIVAAALIGGAVVLGSCTATVSPNEIGVEQVRFGSENGIRDEIYSPGIYFVGPGTTMHTFPREIHVLDATDDWKLAKAEHNKEAAKPKEEKTQRVRLNEKRRLTFKERKELEQLEKDIATLEEEKKLLEADLCSGTLSVDELTEKSKRLPGLNDELDEKTMRWLELSEIEG